MFGFVVVSVRMIDVTDLCEWSEVGAATLGMHDMSLRLRNHTFHKNPHVRKISPVILGRKWLRQFYGRLAFWGSFCWKTPMPIKFLLFGGGVVVFLEGGGGSANFIFMGVGIFPNFCKLGSQLEGFLIRGGFGPLRIYAAHLVVRIA